MSLTLVINAGGESRRMGQTKALLPVPPQNQPLIAHIAQRLSVLTPQRTLIIANDPEIVARAKIPRPVDYLADRYPHTGTLGGIATALEECSGWAMVVACDMPLVNQNVFKLLWNIVQDEQPKSSESQPWDAIVPMVDGYAQTLHALYHPRCLPVLKERLKAKELKAAAALTHLNVRYVTEAEIQPIDPNLHSFTNVNTPEEWSQARERL